MTETVQTKSILKPTFMAVGILLVCLLVTGAVFLELGRNHYANKSIPNQSIAKYSFSGITSQEAQSYLKTVIDQFLLEPVAFEFEDKTLVSSYQDLGVQTDYSQNFKQLKFYIGKPGYFQLLTDLLIIKNYNLRANVDPDIFQANLSQLHPSIALAKSAHFSWDQLNLVIVPETTGNKTNFIQLRKELLNFKNPIQIPSELDVPRIVTTDLVSIEEQFKNLANQKVTLTSSDFSYEIELGANPEVVIFDKLDNMVAVNLDPAYFKSTVEPELTANLNKAPEELSINLVNNKVSFEGTGNYGQEVSTEATLKNINAYLATYLFPAQDTPAPSSKVEIALESADPVLKIDEKLQARGIKELLGYGYTTFHGSPYNRIHNIQIGSDTYNGVIVKQGEKYSFNENLGPVDATAGYLPELVIKAEGTIPEFGGGICQVSTTMYRGALYAGLNIDTRYNHSYVVSYYAQILGDGLDATIYPGSKDFIFVNDTPGDILIQNIVEGTTMTTRIFGTSDGRSVELQGPTVLGRSQSGSPVYQVRNDMAPNSTKQVQKPVNGLSTEWQRIITFADGTIKNETITSRYRAVPAKYLIGPSPTPAPLEDRFNRAPLEN
jgi:vancomycin resistance protein YoaR